LTIVSMALNFGASLITTKKLGASKVGMLGALIGGIIGLVTLNIIGLIIGQFLGAIVGELLVRKRLGHSFKIGISTLVGYLLGVVANSTIALIMIFIFVLKVII